MIEIHFVRNEDMLIDKPNRLRWQNQYSFNFRSVSNLKDCGKNS